MKCTMCEGRGFIVEEISNDLALSIKGKVYFEEIECKCCNGTGETDGDLSECR